MSVKRKWQNTTFTCVLGGSGSLENPQSPHPQPPWEVPFLKLYSSDLHQYAEETSFLLKACFYSHRGGEGGEGEMGTGHNIGKNVLSASDKNV